jgi:hypothetical protein
MKRLLSSVLFLLLILAAGCAKDPDPNVERVLIYHLFCEEGQQGCRLDCYGFIGTNAARPDVKKENEFAYNYCLSRCNVYCDITTLAYLVGL